MSSLILGIDDNLLIGTAGIVTAIVIAIGSPYLINHLNKKIQKKALKSALKYEIHKNFLECQEKKRFVSNAILELEGEDTGAIPAIHGFLHYSAYDAYLLSGFLCDETRELQDLIEKIYDEYHTVSHFLVIDREIMTFFEGDILLQNKIVIYNEVIDAVNRVEPHKVNFDRIFDVNK